MAAQVKVGKTRAWDAAALAKTSALSATIASLKAAYTQMRRHVNIPNFVYLSLAGQAPHYLAEDIRLVAAGPGRRLRSSTDRSCSVPRTYSTSGDRSFAAAGTRVWNSLPSNLRDENSVFGASGAR